jgi:rhodanese-related sulfurtransferase
MNPAPPPDVAATDVPADAFLLDVREPEEWTAGHAPGATHLPLGQLPQRLDELPRDTDIVCVCRGGGRSAQAAALLAGQGFAVRNLDGGMLAWARAGRPLVSEGTTPAEVL